MIVQRPLLFLLCLCSVSSAWDRKKHPPTMAPTNATLPTPSPSNNTTTMVPTAAPHNNNATFAPTRAPTTNTTTMAPTPAPSHTPSTTPTAAPSSNNNEQTKRHWSFWSIMAKTIAWCIIILLVFLGFGAFMSNRYRIYYFLRGVWYSLLAMDCTQRIWRKLTGRGTVDSGLNTIIFEDNPDMSDGLLLRETD
ncbi:hypothetical protein FisN_18Hu225 [Fistulifera solaris]|uniref:Uncharacterized protein n=1 Tax=Fistulifera solaris TaxID=1519565 RepID=A0A1Z5JW05_FISSO|nr:hypothetical protein FisN_18Hu225 [Fistulifera solaris]|eukprot:GAX18012.1 hypothetical protein FisN_18Hu225 [Fistulifera solaris]